VAPQVQGPTRARGTPARGNFSSDVSPPAGEYIRRKLDHVAGAGTDLFEAVCARPGLRMLGIVYRLQRLRADQLFLNQLQAVDPVAVVRLRSDQGGRGWRSAFRTDVYYDSEVMPISVPN
jgi:hypothetical protein